MSGLEEDPFDWWTSKDGRIFISRGGRQVTVVAGARAQRLGANLENARARGDKTAAQHLLARATGNYKRGNERNARSERGASAARADERTHSALSVPSAGQRRPRRPRRPRLCQQPR